MFKFWLTHLLYPQIAETGRETGTEERGSRFAGWLFPLTHALNCLECMDYDISINPNESFLLSEIKMQI